MAAVGCREQQRLRSRVHIGVEMSLQLRQQGWRNVDPTDAGIGLGAANEVAALDLHHTARHLEHALLEIDVLASQFRQLPVPRSAPTAQ